CAKRGWGGSWNGGHYFDYW
nr:immunoglobulin heavy chain junction region [Macaca mulatta]MOX59138.1 immunoglobulin heavy chain junction region [Macaca mulatta]MOX60544.1 immunoglobulin heavy chain junction region [Macaca mulatta]MOX60909.1 immunoglobulin heavy chain junction region [Macaca mulatta]MOX60992.1 immunoglobulin heavy chain junction region [Macaca mulatta]